MIFAQHFVADAHDSRFIGHRQRVNCKTLSIYVYRTLWGGRDLLVPATIAATHRADIHLVVIDHHPDNGTARSPWDSDRTGFNFNFFSVRKLVQHVCVKLLRHEFLLSEWIETLALGQFLQLEDGIPISSCAYGFQLFLDQGK